MNPRDVIRMDGGLLLPGESRRVLCPFCDGGQSRERSMNLTRTVDGVLYKCHRAACPGRGFVGSGASEVTVAREKEPEVYTGEILPLRPEDEKFFQGRYEIVGAGHWIKRNEHDEYVLPIKDVRGYIKGYNVRQPWDGAPCKGRPNRPKSRVYAEVSKPVQAVYGHRQHAPVLLVEDQLSAIKAAQFGNTSYVVALMGCYLDIPRVQEIAMLRPSSVLLALDNDATETAFKLARQYGMAFPSLRVVILDKDLKDTPADEINGVLGL